MDDPLVVVDQLEYQYPGAAQKALSAISFSVSPGSLTAVVGPSEAGKTTLAMSLMGIIPRSLKGGVLSGSVSVAGANPATSDLSALISRVGYLHQTSRLHISGIKPTVLEEVAFPLENIGVPRAEMLARVHRIISQLGLETLGDRDPMTLSGGETQRVALATVLVLAPQILILDEPTGQLDAAGSRSLARILRDLKRTHTIVLIENHLDLVAQIADQILVLKAGRLVRSGTAADVFADPRPDPDVGAPSWTMLAEELQQRLGVDGTSPLPATYRTSLRWFRQLAHTNHNLATANQLKADLRAGSSRQVGRVDSSEIRLEHVSYTYPSGVAALVDVNLAFERGEKILVIGSNGAGKSTLIKLLNGIIRPTQGRVVVGTTDSCTVPRGSLSSKVAVAFQDPSDQLFARSVFEEVLLGPRWLKRADAASVAREALVMVGLDHHDTLHPYDLHPARRRFLTIACMIALAANVCVFDEPSAGLGSSDIRRLLDIVEGLAKQGRTQIIVSHDLDVFLPHCDRVILLDNGRVIRNAPADTFFSSDLRRLLPRGFVPKPLVTRLGQAVARVAVSDVVNLVAAIRSRRTDGTP